MPSTIVDSAIFGNIFSTDAMRAVWSDENRTQKYLDIEAALARVQARLEIIPQEAADEIVRNCTIDKIDMGSMTSAARRCARTVRCLTCWMRLPPFPSTCPVRNWRSCAIPPTIWASPASWLTGC